jgi:hypothetical protein
MIGKQYVSLLSDSSGPKLCRMGAIHDAGAFSPLGLGTVWFPGTLRSTKTHSMPVSDVRAAQLILSYSIPVRHTSMKARLFLAPPRLTASSFSSSELVVSLVIAIICLWTATFMGGMGSSAMMRSKRPFLVHPLSHGGASRVAVPNTRPVSTFRQKAKRISFTRAAANIRRNVGLTRLAVSACRSSAPAVARRFRDASPTRRCSNVDRAVGGGRDAQGPVGTATAARLGMTHPVEVGKRQSPRACSHGIWPCPR